MITKDNDIVVETEIVVTKKTVIVDVSSKLQSKIKKAIKDATGLEIKFVNVSVKNAEALGEDLTEQYNEKVENKEKRENKESDKAEKEQKNKNEDDEKNDDKVTTKAKK